MLSTIAFCLICFVAGLLVWLHRPGSVGGLVDHGFWLPLILPAMVAALFWMGSNEGHGRRLTLSVTEMRIPFADAKADGTHMIFGPQSEKSDFVIGPYADAQQSREVYRSEFDSLLTVKRQGADWKICGKIVEPSSETSLPGMRTTFGDDRAAFGDCRPISTQATRIGIDRLDDADKDVERRHFLLARKADHISIALPPTQTLSQVAGNCADIGKSQVARLAPAGLHTPDRGYRIPDNLVFMQLSQGTDNPLLRASALGPIGSIKDLCAAAPHSFTWPLAKGSERLVFTSRTISIGKWIVGLMFFSSLWTWLFCRLHWREPEGRAEAALVLGLQWLLALRLVIAQAGLFNDGSLNQAAILWPPAVAFVTLPLMAIAILRSGDADDRAPLPVLALLVPFAILAIWLGLDEVTPGVKENILAVIGIGLLLARRFWNTPPSFLELAAIAANRLLGKLRRSASMRLDDYWSIGTALCLVLVTGRLLLLVGDFKERFMGLPFIDNLPFSMAYAPLSIVAMALMISGYRAAPTLWRAAILVSAFTAIFIAVGSLVSDFGMIWIYAWPVGVAIAALIWIKPQQGGLGRLLARAVLLFPVASPLIAAFAYINFAIPPVPSPKADLAGHIEAAAAWDRTAARLQRYIDPQRLVDAGSSASFEMLEHAAQLEPITAHRIGKGYLAPSGIVNPLLSYQYDDNLLAMHIAWPFGRLGLAFYLAALFGILYALWTPRAGGGPQTGAANGVGWRGEAARLAAMTFFWSSAYMALANLNLMPFTGRNAYLLAAKSEGDLAEGFLLLLLIALPLVAMRTRAKAIA